jgi:hypothetical protein
MIEPVNSLLFISIPTTFFIAANVFCGALAFVFFILSLGLKIKFKWRKTESIPILVDDESNGSYNKVADTSSESAGSKSAGSTPVYSAPSVHRAMIAADAVTAFFFTWFLISFSTWSFIPWYVAGILVIIFLTIFYGFWATDFFVQLHRYHSMKRRGVGEKAIAARKRLKRRATKHVIPLIIIMAVAFFIAGITSDVCITFEPIQFSSSFTRSFYKDPCAGSAPCFVYLTLGNNASSQLIVHFQSGQIYNNPTVRFDTQSHSAITDYANSVSASMYRMTRITERTRAVYYGFLNNLAPNTTYYFVAGDGDDATTYSQERKVRTAPLGGGYTFVSGGDMGANPAVEEMSKLAANNELLFAAIGGDIPYENGMVTCYPRWDWWFNMWANIMVTPSGYTVPIVTAIGNHEAGAFEQAEVMVGSYRQFFVHEELNGKSPLELKTYHSHVIGNFMLMALDSWVLEPPHGDQLAWITQQFENLPAQVKFTSAIYHAPMYPSARSYDSEPSASCRAVWEPVFSKYGMTIGLENHDHAFKRTKPIFEGQVANSTTKGVTYVGDGSWGVTSRPPTFQWYHEEVKQATFVLLVDVRDDDVRVRGLSADNTVFTDFTIDP